MKLTSQAFLSLDASSPLLGSAGFDAFAAKFWGSIKTSNGSWKTTSRARLAVADDALFEVIERKGIAPTIAMDIAASSGVTTLDWHNSLKRRGFDVRIIATDRTIACYVVHLPPCVSVLVEPNGHILRIDAPGIGFRPWRSRRDYVNGALLLKVAAKAYVQAQLNRLGIQFPIARSGGPVEGPYEMIIPELRGHPDVSVVEDDVLAPTRPAFVGVADVVRLANVLQHGYFSEDQIRQIVRNVHCRCRPRALVLVCRNKPEGVEGSIFCALSDGRFSLEGRVGLGSEVEPYFAQQ